ncbi:MAG TPA: roadblock/LC7 domain-containing protein [Methylomirabilota bacterium]|jgi:predicted regulator of Ras-like GTPase activity (Roadblock/LC7/MglB family)|nr:roadblock/LC7 domain-containing protein [Methylomirabilota bacterium]
MSAAVVVAQPELGRDLRAVLADLLKLEHIIGALVVAPDGLVIAADLPKEIEAEPLSALAATLGRELELRGPRLRRGTFPMAQFASVSGAVFLGSTPVGFIVLLGEPRAEWETIRAALRRAVGSVYRAWAG